MLAAWAEGGHVPKWKGLGFGVRPDGRADGICGERSGGRHGGFSLAISEAGKSVEAQAVRFGVGFEAG